MSMSRVAVPIVSVALAACVQVAWTPSAIASEYDALIAKHAAENGVPEALVRRVIRIESRGRAHIVHKGNYGLMQIRLGTARSLGYSGSAEGLLDPETNLTYAVKYLAGAYRAGGCNASRTIAYYQRGYHSVKRADCGGDVKLAQAETNATNPASARERRSATTAQAEDVIKPRVVHTELITKAEAEPAPSPARPKFEPVRISTLSATLTPVPLPGPKPAASAAQPEPAMSPQLAALDTEATNIVPLPRVRPEITSDAAPRHHAARSKSARHHEYMQASHPAEQKTAHADKADENKDGAVVSFLKKLTTPAKTSSKQSAQEQGQALSPSQNF